MLCRGGLPAPTEPMSYADDFHARVRRHTTWEELCCRSPASTFLDSVRAIAVFADGARGHWAIENNLHWTLDVTFNEDQSRLRAGHGAKNMAVVRHFALNLVRQVVDKRSIKPPKARRLGSYIPAGDIGAAAMLTSTLCFSRCARLAPRARPAPTGGQPPRLNEFVEFPAFNLSITRTPPRRLQDQDTGHPGSRRDRACSHRPDART